VRLRCVGRNGAQYNNEKCYFSRSYRTEKDRHKWGCSIHEKTLKMASFPAIAIILRAGMGNNTKTFKLLWETVY
jgi:hypothetical protein